jgi:protein-S-isoprenylcysteine O-methyltransferase Ste14
MQIASLIGAIALWAAVHSWLAASSTKNRIRRLAGNRLMRGYRLAYNAFAAISLLPILIWMRLLPDRLLYVVDAPWRYLMLGGQGIAVILLVFAVLATNALHFVGLRQLVDENAAPTLVTSGFYAWVRHPLYLFGLLILWLTPVMTRNLLVAIGSLTAYLYIGALLEERRLLGEFGEAYARYRMQTPMIIPLRVRPRSGPAADAGAHPK